MGMLEDLALFVRVVEKGSFSAAGRDLRLSAALVSHRINALEKRLSTRLFSRTTRAMQLTSAGRVFHERALDVMEAADRAESSIAEEGGVPRGTLRVTAPLGLGRRMLGPAVARFRKTYPEVDVRVRLSEHLLDLVDEGIDVALRLAEFGDSSFILRKVADVERVLVASPGYLAERGAPLSPEQLSQHACLLLRFPGSQQFRWPLARAGEAMHAFTVSGPMDADDGDLLTDWALDGHGIVLKPRFEVAGHLAEGRLVRVLPEYRPAPVTLGIVYLSRQLVPPKIKIFVEALAEEARAYLEREDRKGGVSPA